MKPAWPYAVALVLSAAGCATNQHQHSAAAPAAAPRTLVLAAQPSPVELDLRKIAVIVVDMQNDCVSKGGLFERVGIDVTGIQKIVPRIRQMLELARRAHLPVVSLKMGYRPDLSDIGSEDSPMGVENRRAHVGERMSAPDGR